MNRLDRVRDGCRLPVMRRSLRLAVWTIAVLALAPVAPSFAQEAQAAAVRAAFIFNFAKFTEWPEDTVGPSASLVLCVVDDPATADALEQLVQGRIVGTRRLVVRREKSGPQLRDCALVYASRLDTRRAAELLEPLRLSAVLTISDFPTFTNLGGMARLFIESDRMRFTVNIDAVQRTRLYLSSKLLMLGTVVKDV